MKHFVSVVAQLLSLSSSVTASSGIGRYIWAGINDEVASVSINPNIEACATIVKGPDVVFNATLVYQCLTSLPFQPAVGSRFIKYLNDTLQFQSTLDLLKDPPDGYQQPGIDVTKELGRIQDYINGPESFPNQYAFEATLQRLLYKTHDSHIALLSGVLSAFNFGAPYALTSVSEDGVKLPKVYLWADVIESQEADADWDASAIKEIDGRPVVDYLTDFAKLNSIGGIEPHGDWNQLMATPALDILGRLSVFSGSATFYPNDTITFLLENGTTVGPVPWLAIFYNPGDTGPILDSQDFYDFFVLGLIAEEPGPAPLTVGGQNVTESPPEVFYQDNSTSNFTGPTSWDNPAYPDDPVIVQPDLATNGGGYVTGYFFNDSALGVLSIPSFEAFGDDIDTFSDSVGAFLKKSKTGGIKKIIVDLQQNQGGDAILAFDTFKRFFPNIEPFAASRLRAHPMADVLGNTFTKYWDKLPRNDEDFIELVANEWVATPRINAETGKNFTGWPEFFGPKRFENGDYTTPQQFNLSDTIFAGASLDGFLPFGYGPNVDSNTKPLYEPKDIVLLTDGICASTCALFMEMMHKAGGVPTIVIGGRPVTGPMQATGGTRGASVYSTFLLDGDMKYAGKINATTPTLLPNRTDTGVFVQYASINLRDQIRKSSSVPLQFTYEAANCRLFWTFATVNNYTALWHHAARAAWQNNSLCVEDSRRYAVASNETTNLFPKPSGTTTQPTATPTQFKLADFVTIRGQIPDPIAGSNVAKVARSVSTDAGGACNPAGPACPAGSLCRTVPFQCDITTKKTQFANLCVRTCTVSGTGSTCRDATSNCLNDHIERPLGFPAFWVKICKPSLPRGSPCTVKPGVSNNKENSPGNIAGGVVRRKDRVMR